jgi:hypothetical protein
VLLDFGAARRVISDRTQSLTAILKPSYAPIEQYAEMTQLRQGPWTDLYALGAVIHYLLFGAPPAPATARAVQDDGESIEHRIVPGVSPRFLEAVVWMLAIRPNQRPQSGEQLRAVLDGNAAIPPRGRPGITIPPLAAAAPASSAYEPTRRVDPMADPTRIATAHIPTHLPTAHVPPPGQMRPTTFSPTAQMPTPRAPPLQFDAPSAAPLMAPTQAGVRPSEWPASRPATLPPPLPAAPMSQPMPHETQPPRTRPAPLAAAAAAAVAQPAARSGGSKAGLVAVGVVALVVIGAAAAWQLAGKRDGAAGDTAANAASAAAPLIVAPPPAAPVPVPATAQTQTQPATVDGGSTSPTAAATTSAPPPVAAAPTASPDETKAGSPSSRPATTTATRNESPAGATPRPPPPDREAGLADRNAAADRSTLNSDSAGSRVRPVGRPVPRLGDNDAAVKASLGNPTGRTPDSSAYGNSGGNSSERPRPLGAPAMRDPSLGIRQAPIPVPVARAPQPVDNQPASAREACGKRVFIALAVCMDERCEEPRYRNSEDCVAILARKRERENR